MPRPSTKQSATKLDKLQEAHDRLTQAVESIVSGEDWQRMLKVASKFHRYSFNNQLMIFMQKPDATLVAGFNRWKSMNRIVRKGEKGIAIFAPCRYKVERKEKGSSDPAPAVEVAARSEARDRPLTEIRGFRLVHVFDVSQTEGEPLEDLEGLRPKLLDGDAPEGIWDALVQQANEAGFEVVRNQRGSENGYCDFLKKEIGVRPDVEPLQAVKTLVHELGHAWLHDEEQPPSREIAEVEVESVAFVVLDALGLASNDYSFPYIARWSEGDSKMVRASAARVIECAGHILKGVEAMPTDRDARSA